MKCPQNRGKILSFHVPGSMPVPPSGMQLVPDWAYSLVDPNAKDLVQRSSGFMQHDFAPKPAYHAMQDVVGLFAESEFLGKVKSVSDIWLLKLREPKVTISMPFGARARART
ncbi:MAG: hypothetical protein MN733_19930 [Nitrososphaera sp.]|nr:hypothetical protein [Nitrososphaera sp.]